MKWSMFNFYVDDGYFLIIRNTLTSSTIRINKNLKIEIDGLLPTIRDDNIFNSDNLIKVERVVKRFLELGVIVKSTTDEKKQYKDLFLKYREDDKTFTVYIVTTTNCQLDCPYCFEGQEKKNDTMTIRDAEQVINWVSGYLINNCCDKLRVVFYGGEPLLNKKTIKYILPMLKNVADDKKLLFEVGILTNAEFLDFETGRFLAKYNLDKVQITLDGPQKCHDSRRYRKISKRGTFRKIINNMLCLLENNFVKKIDLRVNFDKQNIEFIPELFNFLKSHNMEQRVSLSFGMITSTISSKEKAYFEENTPGQLGNAEKYLWLCSEAQKRGFSIPKEFLSGPWCVARKVHSAVILPRGGLLKCISLVGRDEFIFGNIFSSKDSLDEKFTNFKYIDACLNSNCPFVPICGGGCRFEAYLSTGNFYEPHCQRDLIERINKGLVILNYKHN